MSVKQGAMALVLAGILSGCVAPAAKMAPAADADACPADNAMVQTTLYFGLSRPAGKDITAQEWQQFVDRDVTPRFRDGLTRCAIPINRALHRSQSCALTSRSACTFNLHLMKGPGCG